MQRLNRSLKLARHYRSLMPCGIKVTRNASSKDSNEQDQQGVPVQMSIPQCRQPCFTSPANYQFGYYPGMPPPNFPPPSVTTPALEMQQSTGPAPLPTTYGLPPEGNPAWLQQPQPCPTCGRLHTSAHGRVQASTPCGSCCPNYYENRKFGHELSSFCPDDTIAPPFDPLPEFPVGIFRNTSNEQLGPCAAKGGLYQSPEYYSYHHMSYYDLHLNLRRYRIPSPNSNRKP